MNTADTRLDRRILRQPTVHTDEHSWYRVDRIIFRQLTVHTDVHSCQRMDRITNKATSYTY